MERGGISLGMRILFGNGTANAKNHNCSLLGIYYFPNILLSPLSTLDNAIHVTVLGGK